LKGVGKSHKPQVERANVVGLRSPDVPSMLVETGFISNPGEESKLSDPKHRARPASAIVDGVRNHLRLQAPSGTRCAARQGPQGAPGTWYAARQGQLGGSRQHVVVRGEALSQIAARHGVPMASIRAANGLKGDMVKAGERLTIPVATQVAAAPD